MKKHLPSTFMLASLLAFTECAFAGQVPTHTADLSTIPSANVSGVELTKRQAKRLGFTSFGKLKRYPARVAVPYFVVKYTNELPPRNPMAKPGPTPPPLPDAATLQALTDRMFARFQERIAAHGYEIAAPSSVNSDPELQAWIEDNDPTLWSPSGYRALPTDQGHPAELPRFAAINRSLGVDASWAVTVEVRLCESANGVVPCIRGEDTAYGYGEPGFSIFLLEGAKKAGKSRVRLASFSAELKRYTYDATRNTSESDRPIFPKVETDWNYALQAEDTFAIALDASMDRWERRAKGKRAKAVRKGRIPAQ